MSLKNVSNSYNLLLSLGAFYSGIMMLLGNGVFSTFPPEWVGKMPFNDWASLAIFGIIIFGFGNAVSSIYGLIKQDYKLFILTFIMGVLFFLCTVLQMILLGAWYLATGQFLLASLLQISLGLFGLVSRK